MKQTNRNYIDFDDHSVLRNSEVLIQQVIVVLTRHLKATGLVISDIYLIYIIASQCYCCDPMTKTVYKHTRVNRGSGQIPMEQVRQEVTQQNVPVHIHVRVFNWLTKKPAVFSDVHVMMRCLITRMAGGVN